MQDRWEHYEHGADIGVRGFGATLLAAFEQAALALTAIVTDPRGVAASEPVDIACEAPDNELLFAEWLNALVYEMAVRRAGLARKVERLFGAALSRASDARPTHAWPEDPRQRRSPR